MSRRLTGLSTIDRTRLPAECGGCTFWQSAEALPRQCGAACDETAVDEWSRRVLNEWGEFGRAAVEDGEVLGFIKYAPPAYLPQIRHMPSGPPEDGAAIIACMHIVPEARRRGLGGVLLREAMRDLAQRGERAAQAYATTAGDDYRGVPFIGVEFLLRNGFTVVRPHPDVPLLRVDLKSLVSWTENLEAVLESLRLPMRVPKHAPATLSTRRGEQ